MGQVIPIVQEQPNKMDSVEQHVAFCYEQLAKDPSFRSRGGQQALSVDIARALIAKVPIAAEAPTGTGKTIAYLIGAITAAKFLEVKKQMTIVIATATVGLQQQIMTGDLPRFQSAGLIDKETSLLAKGRSRYFCISNAERHISGGNGATQTDFFDRDKTDEATALHDIQSMLDNWYSRSWNGDFDSWKGVLSEFVERVRASSDTCISQKCEHYSSCPFFSARRQLATATIVVANHDLVLADLAMSKGEQDPLFPAKEYIVAFDEAHHLPDKALEMGANGLQVTASLLELPKFNSYAKSWNKNHELMKLLKRARVDPTQFDPTFAINAMQAMQTMGRGIPTESDTNNFRFISGMLPSELVVAAKNALGSYYILYDSLQAATKTLKSSEVAQKSLELRALSNEVLYIGAQLNRMLKNDIQALENFVRPGTDSVKWMAKTDTALSFHSSPLQGSEVLKTLLWGGARAIPAFVSATIQDFDGFDRFKDKLGIGGELRTTSLPHIFPYEECFFDVVNMVNSPKFDSRVEFEKELEQVLPRFIDTSEGTLVLFPSRRLQRKLVPMLKAQFPGMVLVQGEMGIKELIARHKEQIDAGRGSILCGLSTLSEGLDLPGAYCVNVMICQLPFSAPNSPIEQELQERMGSMAYFQKKCLPDTLVKLVQMVGRLMRRETDRGRITCLDRRISSTNWGQKLLQALPNFKKRGFSPDRPPMVATIHHS